MMRRVIVLLLLLPLGLTSQVKILMPVVVKDASGKAVTDLKQSDFQVSGPKNVSIDKMWLVEPQTVSDQDSRIPVTVLYDAADATCGTAGVGGSTGSVLAHGFPDGCANLNPELRIKWLRGFLGKVAKDRLPVTFLISTTDGLQLIYDPTTPPEVLSAALVLTENPKATTSDSKIEEQAGKLALLSSTRWTNTFRFDPAFSQMNSLIALAHSLENSEKRKLVIWLADPAYFCLSCSNKSSPNLPIYEVAVEQLNAAHVTVYPDLFGWSGFHTIGISYPSFYGQEHLAESLGGLSLTKGSIGDAIQAALEDFGPYYMLAVAVPTPKNTDWIPVKIKVNRPGLTVRAAPGFLGLKPEKASKAEAAHP